MRFKIWTRLLVLVAAAGLAACGSSDDGDTGAGGSEPLKIGLIPPGGGPIAQLGENAKRGWEYAAKEVNANGGVDGHNVEIVTSTTDLQPETTVRAARRLVTQEDARFLSGVVSSPELGALQQQLPGMGAIALLGNGQDDALTGEGCSDNAFRATHSASMLLAAFNELLPQLPAKRWAIQAVDYSTGHTAAELFKAAAEKAGKEIVLEQFAPLGTTEWGSYITKLRGSGADGFFGLVPSLDGVAFINQASQFRLFDDFKSVLGYDMVTVPNLPALGAKTVGFYSNLGYDVTADNAKNSAFVKGFEAEYGEPPYTVSADNYLAAQMLFEAVRKAGSIEPADVKDALEGISFDSFAGRVTMGADHQLVRASYVGEVVEKGAGYAFKTIAEAPPSTAHPAPDPACKL